MATINPTQMNQPVKALNSNQSTNGDSQESFIDQSFASFPDELEAAKGQSQNTSTSTNSSDPKTELVENLDLQNLPVTVAVGVINPANIAAAIQVMAPVDAPAIEIINLEQLQLASLNAQASLTPEQVITDLAPTLDTSADAQLIAQNLVSADSLAIASQNIQNTLVEDKSTVVVQQNIASITQLVDQPLVVESDAVQAVTNEVASNVAAATLNPLNATVNEQKNTSEVSVDSQDAASLVTAAPVVNIDSGLVGQAASLNAKVEAVTVNSVSSIQASATIDSTLTVDAAQLTSDQKLVPADQNMVKDFSGVAQQAIVQDADIGTQGNLVAESIKSSSVLADVDLNPVNDAAKTLAANQVADDAQVALNILAPSQGKSEGLQDVAIQAVTPELQQVVPSLKADGQTSIKVISGQVVADKNSISQTQIASAPVSDDQVGVDSSFVVDGKQIELSRDDLAQSDDILAARAESAKLAKSDTGIQVNQLSTIEVKDFNKIDGVNNGFVMTDANRSTFVDNSNQELKLAQAAPIKLEPHNVSLATGPLNIEVMRVLKEGGGRVIMEVTPPDQGTLQLDLRLDNQGKAILIVDGASDSTRARLEQGSAELRQQLAEMGLQLSLNMRQKSDSDDQFRFASSSDDFGNSKNRKSDSPSLDQVGGIISNQINNDGRVHLYA
jgi:Flagellar hook-length control protein FliK